MNNSSFYILNKPLREPRTFITCIAAALQNKSTQHMLFCVCPVLLQQQSPLNIIHLIHCMFVFVLRTKLVSDLPWLSCSCFAFSHFNDFISLGGFSLFYDFLLYWFLFRFLRTTNRNEKTQMELSKRQSKDASCIFLFNFLHKFFLVISQVNWFQVCPSRNKTHELTCCSHWFHVNMWCSLCFQKYRNVQIKLCTS